MLQTLSLFSGIGGIELGMSATGRFEPLAFVERDPFCQQVLGHHWPAVPIFDDVSKMPAACPARPDVITAGFPCQPVSYAGRRKAQDDERWLWPHVERCIRILRPRGVVLENVPGLLTAGFDDVLAGLAACGYDAEWDCIPAAAVGAPHLRDRVFIIAAPRPEFGRHLADGDNAGPRHAVRAGRDAAGDGGAVVADAHGATRGAARSAGEPVHEPGAVKRLGRRGGLQPYGGWPSPMAYAGGKGSQGAGDGRATSDGVGEGRIWPVEPRVGRVANGIPGRVDKLRALGNAVVPQVAEFVALQLLTMMGETDHD